MVYSPAHRFASATSLRFIYAGRNHGHARLQPGESERLMGAAGGLRDLISAALETECRRGELLSMQWHHVRFSPRAELFLPAVKTKLDRRVPISTELRRVLDGGRHDPAGELIPPDGYVFGDELGRRRHSFKTA